MRNKGTLSSSFIGLRPWVQSRNCWVHQAQKFDAFKTQLGRSVFYFECFNMDYNYNVPLGLRNDVLTVLTR